MAVIDITAANVYNYMLTGALASTAHSYNITENIDLSTLVDGGASPIDFTGFPALASNNTVNGNGYTLSNWTFVNNTFSENNFGLWRSVSGGSSGIIKNLIIDNFDITLTFTGAASTTRKVALLCPITRLDYGSMYSNTIRNSTLTVTNDTTDPIAVGLLSGCPGQSGANGGDIKNNKVYNNTVELTYAGNGYCLSSPITCMLGTSASVTPASDIANNLSVKNSITVVAASAIKRYGESVAFYDQGVGAVAKNYNVINNVYCDSGDDTNSWTDAGTETTNDSETGYTDDSLKQQATYLAEEFSFLNDITYGYDFAWTMTSDDAYAEPVKVFTDNTVMYASDNKFFYWGQTYTLKSYIMIDTIPYTVLASDATLSSNGVMITADRDVAATVGTSVVEDPTEHTVVDKDINGRIFLWDPNDTLNDTGAAGGDKNEGEYIGISDTYVYIIVSTEDTAGEGYWLTTTGDTDPVVKSASASYLGADVGYIQLKLDKGHGFADAANVVLLDGSGDLFDTLVAVQSSGSFYITLDDTNATYDLLRLDRPTAGTAYVTPYEQGEVTKIAAYDATLVSNLTHLAGEDVSVTIDGVKSLNTEEGSDGVYTVSSTGTLDLPENTARAVIGLPYTSLLVSVPIDTPDRFNPFTDVTKTIEEVYVRWYRSRGGEISLNEDTYAPIDATYDATNKLDKKVKTNTKHKFDQKICVRQTDPYPFTVLNLIPNIRKGSGR